jgi:hypothetical protein
LVGARAPDISAAVGGAVPRQAVWRQAIWISRAWRGRVCSHYGSEDAFGAGSYGDWDGVNCDPYDGIARWIIHLGEDG